MKRLAWLLAIALLGLACSDDRPAECEEIGEACHAFDTGSGTAHDCHESSEADWTAAECTANRAMCLAACSSSTPDAGAADARAVDAAP